MSVKTKRTVSRSVIVGPAGRPVGRKGYDALVRAVRRELEELDVFIRRRTAECYWRVGKFIHEHLLGRKDRAEHGSHFFERLARDAGRDASTLQKMVRFYRAYPILARGPELSWSHYRVLIGVKDKAQRDGLEKETLRQNWDAQRLREHVRVKRGRVIAAHEKDAVPQLEVTRGRLHVYKVMATDVRGKGGGELLIDHGFGVRRPFPDGKAKGFQDGDLLERSGRGYVKTDIGDTMRYTYKAYVERVVDGDTLLVLIEGGGGNLVQERLRLRGIDCPEIKTEAGRKAKRFVERRLQGLPFIIIRTYREEVDRHARYITDVFYLPGETDAEKAAARGNFLNQELLDGRLASAYP